MAEGCPFFVLVVMRCDRSDRYAAIRASAASFLCGTLAIPLFFILYAMAMRWPSVLLFFVFVVLFFVFVVLTFFPILI